MSDSSSKDERVLPRLQRAFRQHFGDAPSGSSNGIVVARAPGRVNLLGGHTDYNDGFVLPATIDRTVHVALRARDAEIVRLHSVNFEEEAEYTLADPDLHTLPAWARYLAGVAEELRQQGHTSVHGFDAVVQGDVPLGAGLSSSAALEVATAVGLSALFSLDLDPVETAKLCQHVEQAYVGVECGIMDQFAARLGRSSCALFLDCRSLEHHHLPLPLDEACLVVTDSRVNRELASSKYNERRRECEQAARFFRQYDEDIRALRDVSKALLEEEGPALSEPLFRRARHVVRENRRVEQGARLLAEGQLEAFGRLMNASHASLRNDYEVSCEELDLLTDIARATDGVLGTRMTGAGFGGCTITLARPEAVPHLKDETQRRYAEGFGFPPELYVIERNLEAAVL